MPLLSGSEFTRKIKSRLNSQNRGGAIPLTPRLLTLTELWNYARFERPQDRLGNRFFFVINQHVQLSLAEVDYIELLEDQFRVKCSNGLSGLLWGPLRDGLNWHTISHETQYNTPWESISVGHIRPAVEVINTVPCRGRSFSDFFDYVVRPAAVEMGLPNGIATAELIRYVQVAVPNVNRSIRNYLPTFLEGRRECATTKNIVRSACMAWHQYLQAEFMVAQQRSENGGVSPIVMPNPPR